MLITPCAMKAAAHAKVRHSYTTMPPLCPHSQRSHVNFPPTPTQPPTTHRRLSSLQKVRQRNPRQSLLLQGQGKRCRHVGNAQQVPRVHRSQSVHLHRRQPGRLLCCSNGIQSERLQRHQCIHRQQGFLSLEIANCRSCQERLQNHSRRPWALPLWVQGVRSHRPFRDQQHELRQCSRYVVSREQRHCRTDLPILPSGASGAAPVRNLARREINTTDKPVKFFILLFTYLFSFLSYSRLCAPRT